VTGLDLDAGESRRREPLRQSRLSVGYSGGTCGGTSVIAVGEPHSVAWHTVHKSCSGVYG
jgi:hypothetical protein